MTMDDVTQMSRGNNSFRNNTENLMKRNFMHKPCPPDTEKPKRQRPFHGLIPTSTANIKFQRTRILHTDKGQVESMPQADHICFDSDIGGKHLCEAGNPDLKSFSGKDAATSLAVDKYSIGLTPAQPLICETNDENLPVLEVNDVKSEQKRKKAERKVYKRKIKKDTKVKEHGKFDAEIKVENIFRNKSLFNGNRDTLPAIGKKEKEKVHLYIRKLPDIDEPDLSRKPLPHNNIVDVIRKHETEIRKGVLMHEKRHEYINTSARLKEHLNKNEAFDISKKYKQKNGKPNHELKENNTNVSCPKACKRAKTIKSPRLV